MVLIYSRQMKKLKKEWIGHFHGLILFCCFNYQFTAAVDGTSNFLLAVLNFVNRGHKRDIKEEQASGFRGLASFCLRCLIGGVLVWLWGCLVVHCLSFTSRRHTHVLPLSSTPHDHCCVTPNSDAACSVPGTCLPLLRSWLWGLQEGSLMRLSICNLGPRNS